MTIKVDLTLTKRLTKVLFNLYYEVKNQSFKVLSILKQSRTEIDKGSRYNSPVSHIEVIEFYE